MDRFKDLPWWAWLIIITVTVTIIIPTIISIIAFLAVTGFAVITALVISLMALHS